MKKQIQKKLKPSGFFLYGNMNKWNCRNCRFIAVTLMIFLMVTVAGNPFFSPPPTEPNRPDWVGIWGIWGGEDYGGPEWPWYKGTLISSRWKDLEPEKGQWNFSSLDADLNKASDNGIYAGIIIYHGDKTPAWVYNNGVPEVESSNGKSYPYYLDPDFKPLLVNMINKVAEHVKDFPVVLVQATTGVSGDLKPYNGDVPPEYEISNADWEDWNAEIIVEYEQAYSNSEVTILIKAKQDYHEFFKTASPDLGRKTRFVHQCYQANSEMTHEWLREDVATSIRARGELDHAINYEDAWFFEAPRWNMYWQSLWMLTYGLDIFNQRTQALDDPSDYIEAYTFFTDHAGYKSARDSKTAWCALRDGLDYLDTERFPESTYGSIDNGENKARYSAIVDAMAPYGAHQGDPDYTNTNLFKYFKEIGALNDVAYNIWPGNYRNFLYQIDANATSQGHWRVGPKSQPYGRFARGFNHAEGKDTLFFDIDDDFFSNNKVNSCEVTVRVVYYDEGEGSWALKYHASGNTEKTAFTVTKTNTGQRKEKIISVSDGVFSNGCKRNADLMLVNADNHDDIFHMVEINLKNCLQTRVNYFENNDSKKTQNHSKIKIYPNPAGDQVFIDLPEELPDSDIVFYYMKGNLIKMESNIYENHRISCNIKNFQPGVYWVMIISKDGFYKGKIVKQ